MYFVRYLFLLCMDFFMYAFLHVFRLFLIYVCLMAFGSYVFRYLVRSLSLCLLVSLFRNIFR